MANTIANVNASETLKQFDLVVNIHGYRRARWRIAIGAVVIRFGAWLAGFNSVDFENIPSCDITGTAKGG